jgi:hypothetical protein
MSAFALLSGVWRTSKARDPSCLAGDGKFPHTSLLMLADRRHEGSAIKLQFGKSIDPYQDVMRLNENFRIRFRTTAFAIAARALS